MPNASSAVQATQFHGVGTDIVEEIGFGLETIDRLVFQVTCECGKKGQYIHLAMGNLASNLAKRAQDSVESVTQEQGVDTDAVEDFDFGLRSIGHLSMLADEECGTDGHHLRFAIRKLAESLAELARVSVDAACLNGGAA